MTGTITENGSTDHSFWRMFYSQLLSEIGLKDDAVRDQLVAGIQNSGNWDTIRPGTAEQLHEIGERYRIAVISNADGKIADVLQKCGIAHCFRTITDSGLVGYEKPHPEIFRKAMLSMNAAPEESLYVGDVYSVDYLGATGAGMQALLMDVPGAYRDKGVPRVESLAELQMVLRGLAVVISRRDAACRVSFAAGDGASPVSTALQSPGDRGNRDGSSHTDSPAAPPRIAP